MTQIDYKKEDGWIHVKETWEEFCRQNLHQPGIIIIVDDEKYLIGDVNPMGGGCDGCRIIWDDAVIDYYKRLEDVIQLLSL